MICIWNLIPRTNSTSDYWKDKKNSTKILEELGDRGVVAVNENYGN